MTERLSVRWPFSGDIIELIDSRTSLFFNVTGHTF